MFPSTKIGASSGFWLLPLILPSFAHIQLLALRNFIKLENYARRKDDMKIVHLLSVFLLLIFASLLVGTTIASDDQEGEQQHEIGEATEPRTTINNDGLSENIVARGLCVEITNAPAVDPSTGGDGSSMAAA